MCLHVHCNCVLDHRPSNFSCRSVVDAHVQKTWTTIETCTNCYQAGDVTICDVYTCYGAYVEWLNVCTEKLGTWGHQEDANAKAALYTPGAQQTVWISKAKPVTCTSNESSVVIALPIVGITFLTLTGFFIVTSCTILILELFG